MSICYYYVCSVTYTIVELSKDSTVWTRMSRDDVHAMRDLSFPTSYLRHKTHSNLKKRKRRLILLLLRYKG